MSQLPLNLVSTPVYLEQNFIRSACNEEALDWIMRWPDWPSFALLLYGEPGCGKTHLGHIWAARAGAATGAVTAPMLQTHTLLDDISHYDETLLFHLLNLAREERLSLLLIAGKPAAQLAFTLPDLTSRLKALPSVGIHPPDDALLGALMHKQFSDRQLQVEEEVISYLLPRIERSFAAIAAVVKRLDQASLSQQRRMTVPFVRHVMRD